MWILPNQLIQSHSLKVTEELSEALSLLENELDQSLLVRSKPMPSRTLSQRWKKGHWIRTLFGRMPKPSQASNFLEKWISSQEDSHVSHSVQQVEEKPTKIQDICGLLALEPSISSDLKEFCSKMSKDLLAQSSVAMGGATQKGHQYCSMSVESWKDEVTRQRGEYSQRVKQARHIRESESSSLVNWPTATVAGLVEGGVSKNVKMTEEGFKSWRDGTKTEYGAKLRDSVVHYEAKNWPTPNTMDTLPPKSQEALDRNRQKGGCANLREWIHHEGTYNYEAKNWPTPTARDWKGHYPPNKHTASNGANRLKLLPDAALYGLQGQENHKEEWKSLELNPNWVEQLMGLTTGSTDLGYWGME
jgi:hypothetical protein